MRDLVRLIVWAVVDLFRSRAALEAEILTLRQQIIVLRRTAPKKQSFGAIDRLVFVGLYRLFPKVCDALAIVKPDTVVRWHRAGFRLYWRWKSTPAHKFSVHTTPLSIARSSASAPSSHDLSLAAFTINIAESNSAHTGGRPFCETTLRIRGPDHRLQTAV